MAWLPHGEKISKISLFFLAQLTNVTGRQTDGHRMPAIAALCISRAMHSIAQQKQVNKFAIFRLNINVSDSYNTMPTRIYESEPVVLYQSTGALQYLKYNTLYLTVTWQFKAPLYVTSVSMDSSHQPCLLCLLCATESTGHLINYLAVKVPTAFE